MCALPVQASPAAVLAANYFAQQADARLGLSGECTSPHVLKVSTQVAGQDMQVPAALVAVSDHALPPNSVYSVSHASLRWTPFRCPAQPPSLQTLTQCKQKERSGRRGSGWEQAADMLKA